MSKFSTAVKKRLYALKSRSVRFLAACGALWLALPELLPLLREALPELAGILPDNIYKALSAIVIVGALYYRFRTHQPVSAYKLDADNKTGGKEQL